MLPKRYPASDHHRRLPRHRSQTPYVIRRAWSYAVLHGGLIVLERGKHHISYGVYEGDCCYLPDMQRRREGVAA